MSDQVVLGVGLSSRATAEEVSTLVGALLDEHGLRLADLSCVATRQHFVDDERLRLGPPVVGYADDVLEAASAPCARSVGIHARVAETAALLAVNGPAGGHLLSTTHRSSHATVALAATPDRTRP